MSDIKRATSKQTWALFCITKKDYRNDNLTYDEASALIDKLNAEKGYAGKSKGTKAEKANFAVELHNAAILAGEKALEKCIPVPMIVEQHSNMLDDKSPVEKSYFVDGGVCGFASVYFKANTPENRKFLAGLKKAGLASDKLDAPWRKNSHKGGFSYWVSQGGQSLQRKEAFARAFASVLQNTGITCYMESRMD